MMEFKQEETDEAAAAEKTLESNEEISKEDVENLATYQGEKKHTQRGETTIEKVSKQIVSGTRKERKDGRDSTNTRRLQRD